MKYRGIIAGITFGLLTACTHHQQNVDPTNLNQLENMTADAAPQPYAVGIGGIRISAIKDTAMSLGAQGGLAAGSKQINTHLEKYKWYMETTYNFNGMMLSHGVLPPVLAEGSNELNLDDPNTIRVADKTYRVIQQARFTTTPPNWRDYLWMNFPVPELPNKVLLPNSADERKVWAKSIKEGWEKGIQQAFSIFQQNLARLRRDYNGMILYRKLLQQHMVSAPYVSRTELGVTGDGSNMRVNDQVLHITELPKLQTDTDNWRAIVVKNDD